VRLVLNNYKLCTCGQRALWLRMGDGSRMSV
jgi:hypothetical protein